MTTCYNKTPEHVTCICRSIHNKIPVIDMFIINGINQTRDSVVNICTVSRLILYVHICNLLPVWLFLGQQNQALAGFVLFAIRQWVSGPRLCAESTCKTTCTCTMYFSLPLDNCPKQREGETWCEHNGSQQECVGDKEVTDRITGTFTGHRLVCHTAAVIVHRLEEVR